MRSGSTRRAGAYRGLFSPGVRHRRVAVGPVRSVSSQAASYLGILVNIGFGMPVAESVRAFAGLGVGYVGGAANADSPLFRDELNISGGIGFIWTAYESEERTFD